MALAVNTPYKTNTLASTSSTAFTSNGTPFVGGDVGRFIVMTNGPAVGQVRKIVSLVSSSVVNLDYAFNVSPLASRGFTEVYPSAGNTWVMSWTLEELANGVELINSNGNIRQPWAGPAITVASGVFIAQCDRSIYLNADLFSLAFGSYLQFGHISSSGTPINGVMFEDGSNASPGGWSAGGYSGNLRIYGSRIKSSSGFWRLYSGATAYHRIIGNIFSGGIGMRVMGTLSILADNIVDSCTSAIGPWHPASPIGLVENNTVREGLAAAYINFGWLDAVVKGTRTKKLSYYIAASLGAPNRAGNEYVEDFVEDEVTACVGGAILSADTQSGCGGAYFRFSNYIDTAIVDSSLGLITDYARRVIRNGAGDTVNNTTSNTSSFARFIALRKTFDFAVTGVSKSWASGVESGPYTQGICCYGYQPLTLTMPLATSSNLTLTLLADMNITEPVRSVVQAYGSLANLDQLYDAYKSWLVTNFATPWPTFGVQKVTGQGTTLDCGDAHIVVDGTAAAAFAANTGTNTITIKASALAAGAKFSKLVTSGSISFINGAAADAALIYADATATSVPIVVGGIRNGTKVRVVRTDTEAELAIGTAGASGFVARLAWAADLPIRADTTYTSGLDCEHEASALGTLTANGALLTVVQEPCTIYETNGRVGADVTGLVLDAPNVEADADEFDNRMAVQEFYAWYKYTLMSDAGIRTLFGAITAENAHKYRVNASKCPLKIDQKDLVNTLLFTGGLIYRDDGESIRLAGSGSIEMIPDDVYESAAAEQSLAAIKAKTDSLSFTVSGQVDANIQYVNDVAVTGNGQAGTEWGPG